MKVQFCSLDNAKEAARDSKGNADGLGVRDLPHATVRLWRAGLFPSSRCSTGLWETGSLNSCTLSQEEALEKVKYINKYIINFLPCAVPGV